MLDSHNFTTKTNTTSINGTRHQSHKNDNKTSCFILNTIHYKKRRREKNTMTMLQQSNNVNNLTEKIQCLLCRKIIESNDHYYQEEPQNINNNKSLNICVECQGDTNTIFHTTNDNNYFDLCPQQEIIISDHDRNRGERNITNCKNDKSIKKLLSENSCSCNGKTNNNNYNKNIKKYSKMYNWKQLLVLLLLNICIRSVYAQNSSKFNSNVTAEPGGE